MSPLTANISDELSPGKSVRWDRSSSGLLSAFLGSVDGHVIGVPKLRKARDRGQGSEDRGFSTVELIMVLLIGSVLTAAAVPQIKESLYNYRLRSAVASATWAIQSTRFQALMEGYPFQVTMSGGSGGVNPSYQIASEPIVANGFVNVGSSVPLSGSPVSINQTEVLQFLPNGTVATSPASNAPYSFTISYQGTTKTITVSNYGNVSVTP